MYIYIQLYIYNYRICTDFYLHWHLYIGHEAQRGCTHWQWAANTATHNHYSEITVTCDPRGSYLHACQQRSRIIWHSVDVFDQRVAALSILLRPRQQKRAVVYVFTMLGSSQTDV